MRTPYDLTHGLAQWRTQGPGNLRSQFIRDKQKRNGTEVRAETFTLAIVPFLPTLEALYASRGCCAFSLGRDRRFGAFQVVSLVARRTCYFIA